MLLLLLRWVLSALALEIIAKIVPGIDTSFGAALGAAIILGLINALLRPLLVLITLPLTILTFGLFLFVLNACLFALAAWITPGFSVHGFAAALVGSILYAISGVVIMLVTNRLDARPLVPV
jgi:putative membrane protein